MRNLLKALPTACVIMLVTTGIAAAQYGYTYDCVPGDALVNGVCQPVPPAIGGAVATKPTPLYSYPYWNSGGYAPYGSTGWPEGFAPDYYYGK